MKAIFQTKIEVLNNAIKPTIANRGQYQINYENTFFAEKLTRNVAAFERNEKLIGKLVFQYKNRIGFEEHFKNDVLNQLEETQVLLTQEMYDEFVTAAVKYWIEYYTNNLVTHSLSQSSTNKMANLEYEWECHVTQQLIKFYKRSLGLIS